jgi:hypothetical protein
MLMRKKSNLEPGYVFAPYIPMTTTSVEKVNEFSFILFVFSLDFSHLVLM